VPNDGPQQIWPTKVVRGLQARRRATDNHTTLRERADNEADQDMGVFLRNAITGDLKRNGTAITLKYIDHSYTIRSVPAHDSLLPAPRAERGLRGRTNMVVSFWNDRFTHVPFPCGLRALEDRSGGHALEQCDHINRSAVRHALWMDQGRNPGAHQEAYRHGAHHERGLDGERQRCSGERRISCHAGG
jgi:hypothetical protein